VQNQEQINRLKNTVQDILDEAVKQGASAAEAGLSQGNGLSVSVRLGDVETIEHHCDQGLGVTVYFGQRKGSASTTVCRQLQSEKRSVRHAALPVTPVKMSVQVCRNKSCWPPNFLILISIINECWC
jgi:hypothetical protein